MTEWTLLHYNKVVDSVPLFYWTQICHLDERYEYTLRSKISLLYRITSTYPSRFSVHLSLACSVLGRLNYTDCINRPFVFCLSIMCTLTLNGVSNFQLVVFTTWFLGYGNSFLLLSLLLISLRLKYTGTQILIVTRNFILSSTSASLYILLL